MDKACGCVFRHYGVCFKAQLLLRQVNERQDKERATHEDKDNVNDHLCSCVIGTDS